MLKGPKGYSFPVGKRPDLSFGTPSRLLSLAVPILEVCGSAFVAGLGRPVSQGLKGCFPASPVVMRLQYVSLPVM